MTKSSKSKTSAKEQTSWWTTLPGILTAITTLILAISGLIGAIMGIAAKWPEWFPPPAGNCSEYMDNFLNSALHLGKENQTLFEISSNTSLENVRIIVLDDETGEIGKLKFAYETANDRFEILSVVDTECRAIQQKEGQNAFYVKNGEAFPLKLVQRYTLTLTFANNIISGTFEK